MRQSYIQLNHQTAPVGFFFAEEADYPENPRLRDEALRRP